MHLAVAVCCSQSRLRAFVTAKQKLQPLFANVIIVLYAETIIRRRIYTASPFVFRRKTR